MRVALIEDNENVAKGIVYSLEDRGHVVDRVGDGMAADAFLRADGNDVVVLDVNLPGLSGLEILRSMRARADVRPVLILTAQSDVADRIAGLDAGADDYLIKPFDMDELEARIRALMRRRPKEWRTTLTRGPLAFEVESRRVTLSGTVLDLPRRELAVLEALLRAEGRVVSKPALIEQVYGTGADVDDTAVEAHVSRLRKRLRAGCVDIRAQRGLGYRLDVPEEAP